MISRRFLKTDRLEIAGRTYTVDYFEGTTERGTYRYSSELALGPGDRVILDGGSLSDLEWRVARVISATLDSRRLTHADA